MKTLRALRSRIKTEVPYVDVKPYSHNIIGLTLSIIERDFGKPAAIKAMKDFHLDELGWTIPKKESGGASHGSTR